MIQSLFGFPNHADAGTPSLGSWEASAPLTNVQDRRLHRVAQSTDATAASTIIGMDLGQERSIKIAALLLPNATRDATVRVTASAEDDYDPTEDQTEFLDVYPDSFTQDMWDAGIRAPFVYIPPAAVDARYWRYELVDESNPDGHLEVARVWLSSAWAPSSGAAGEGSELGIIDLTERVSSPAGARYYMPVPQRLSFLGTFPGLSEEEAITEAWRLQRMVGVGGELWWVWDKDDPYMYARSYLATLEKTSPLLIPVDVDPDATFALEQVL